MKRMLANNAARPVRVLATLAVIAGLYMARDLLIPAALAVLLAFLLYPIVRALARIGLPHAAAVVVAVAVAGSVTGGVGLLVGEQILDLSEKLPDYRENLLDKIRSVRERVSGGQTVDRVIGTLHELRQELSTTQPASGAAVSGVTGLPTPAPMRVEVVDGGPEMREIIAGLIGPLLTPIGGAAITILLLIFLLLQADDIRERFISFAGLRQVSLTTGAMDETATRVSRYLRMQLVVNLSYGTMIGVGLGLFGVPNALLWGVMGTLLRFIPYLGAWLSAILPSLLTAAVFPGWGTLLGVIVMFCAVELLTNMVLEPWLYGASSGISSLGVVVATVFWAWVWGPVGLLLAVPMTACLVVIGKHIPQFALLNHFFGTDSKVPMTDRLYHWLLVGDELAAERLLVKEGTDEKFAPLCDNLLVPVLASLKQDHAQGVIGLPQVRQAIGALEASLPIDLVAAAQAGATAERAMLCIPGRSEIDDCAARLLSAAANLAGVPARVIANTSLISEAAKEAEADSVIAVAVVHVAPASRALLRRVAALVKGKVDASVPMIDLAAGTAADEPAEPVSGRTVRRESSIGKVVERMSERAQLARTAPNSLSTRLGPAAV